MIERIRKWLFGPSKYTRLLQYEIKRLDITLETVRQDLTDSVVSVIKDVKALDADAEQMETDLLKRIEELEQRLNHGSLKSGDASAEEEAPAPQISRMRWSDRKAERIRRSGDMEFMKRKIQKVTEGSDAKV